MADGQIKYSVGFDVQKQGLNQLKKSLQELQKLTTKDLMKINTTDAKQAAEDFSKIKTQIQNVQVALRKAFNAKLNTTNIEAFKASLKESQSSVQQVYQALKLGGAAGENAFRNLSTQVLSTNVQLRESHSILDKMATTLGNSLKWSLASGAVNTMSRSIEQAYGYVKALDGSLNDIRIVTGKTADEMDRFAEKANNAAKNLGTSTTDYTNAALIYAQQGLSDQEVEARTAVTLKAANVTGQSTEEVSEQLTAVWNGYKVSADEAEVYVDRLAAIAATTASDLQELSTGMSKVASAASMMGVSEQQLAAQLSTIISATKQAPQSVGTALRTVYARISDIKAGIDEEGVSLGNYSGKMKELGFNVLDMNGNLRDMGEVIEEIGNHWGELTREQQVSLAQTMAGQRQYSNLVALFDNFDEYNRALATAQNAAGTLQQQQDIYMESTAAHLDQLKASMEDIYDSLIDNDSINGVADALSNVADFVANFVDSLGGGISILEDLGAVGVMVFSEQIARSINTTITNFEAGKTNAQELAMALQEVEKWQGIPGLDDVSKKLLADRQQMLQLAEVMSPQQFSEMQSALNDLTVAENNKASAEAQEEILNGMIQSVTKATDKWEGLEQVLKNVQQQEEVIKGISSQEQAFNKTNDALSNYIENFKKLQSQIDKTGIDDNASQTIANMRSQLEGYMNDLFDLAANGSMERHEESVEKLANELAKLPEDLSEEEMIAKLQAIGRQLKALAANAGQSAQKTREALENEFQGGAESIRNQVSMAADEAEKRQKIFDTLADNGQRTATIETFTRAAGSVATLGRAIQQVQNLGSIWKNADLSTGEKILQTIINLATTISMAVPAITNLNNLFKLLTASKAEDAAASAADAAANAVETGAITATGAAATKTTFSLQALKTALLTNPITAAIVAFTALAGVLGMVAKAAEEARKAQIQENNATIDEANKKQQQLAKNQELYESIEQLNKKYKEGQISRSDLKSGVEDLIQQYGLEGEAADRLRQNYDNLIQTLKELKAENAEQKLQSSKQQYKAAEDNLKKSFDPSYNKNASLSVENDENGKLTSRYKLTVAPYGSSQQVQDILKEAGFENENGFATISADYNNMTDMVNMYHTVQKAVSDLSKVMSDQQEQAQWYQNLKDWLADSAKQMEAFNNALKDVNQNQAAFTALSKESKGTLDFSNVQNAGDYFRQKQELQEALSKEELLGDTTPQELADSYLLTNESALYNKYNEIEKVIDSIQEKIPGLVPTSVFDQLSKLDTQQLDSLLQAFELSPSSLQNWVDLKDVIESILKEEKTFEEKDLSAMRGDASENYVFYQSLEDQIKKGKSISPKEYEGLAPQIQQLFEMQANGSYKIPTQNLDEFFAHVNELKLDGFKNTVDQVENELNRLQTLSDKHYDYDKLDNEAISQLPMKEGLQQGFNYGLLEDQISYINDTGGATQAVIDKWTDLVNRQRESKETLAGFPEVVKEIHDAVAAVGDQTKDLNEKITQSKDQLKELYHQQHEAMSPVDEDAVDGLQAMTETVQDFATQSDDLAESLAKDTWAAEDVAEGILRFDSAIQDVTKNYDDWIDALSNHSMQDIGEYINDIREAYADLLDLDGDSLSRSFLENAENLELMKEAANGSEQAYNQLRQAAQQDIALQVNLNTDDFNSQVDNLLLQYFDIQNLDDVVVGTDLNDEPFLAKLSNLVDASFQTAQQAQDYLASMGIDAEVTENNVTGTEENETVGYTAQAVPVKGSVSFPQMISGSSETGPTIGFGGLFSSQWEYDALEVQPNTQTQVAKKQNKSFSLKVNSAHKASGGGFKYKQASHGGGSKGGSGGGGKGRGGGGGKGGKGGGGKAAKPDTSKKDPKKKLEDQKDLYHDINIELKGISRDLDRVQKVQERLYGKQLIDNLNKQVAILDKQKEKLKEKQKIQEQDLKNQQKTLKNLGATFDKYGNINNYLSLIQEKQKAVNTLTNRANKIIEQYNASTDAEYKKKLAADIEAYNKQIQKAQEDLKDTQSKISNYDKLREEMQDLVDDIEEITQKQIEINIKKFRTEVQIRLDMGEAERDWNDFVRNVINSDDVLKDTNFDKVFEDAKQNLGDLTSYFETKQVEALANKMMQTRQQIESIDATGTSSIYGDNKAQAMQDLQNDLKELQDQMKDINGLIQDIDEAILDTVDDIDDQLDERLDAYEFVQDLIEHDLDLMQLLYGDRNYDAMDSYYKQLQKNEMDRLNLLRLQGEFWKKNYEDAIANGQTNLAKEYEKNYKDAIKNINSVIEESIETLTDKYANAINKIFDDLNKKITDGKGLDYLDKQWQLMTKNADEYLDAINAAFGVQQLESKFIDAINNTDTLKGQRALKKVMDEQLNNLRSKEKLTQYDVDRAEKLLQIEQARIALEAAQSSKTSLRLQRDSQGNYSYHYVADQQGISEAEDSYNQAVNDLYNFDKDKYKSNLQQMLAAWQEFQSEYTDIKTDMSLSDEERLERLSLLEEQYGEYINGLAQQNTDIRVNLAGSAVDDLANLYSQDAENYEAMTLEERESLVQNLLVPWGEGIQLMIDYINGEGGFLPVTQASFEDLTEVTRNYEMELAQMAAEAGVDLDMVSQGVDQVKDEFELLGMENAELIQLMYGELQAILDLRQVAQGLVTEYQNVCNAAIQAVTQIQAFIQKQQEAAASYQQTAAAYEAMIVRIQNANAALVANPLGDYTGGYDGSGGSSGGSGGGGAGGGGGGGGRPSGSGSSTSSRAPVTPAYRGAMDHTPIALLKRTGGGCFAAGTKIYMADGTYKNIEDIQVDDLVIAYNDKTQKYENKKVIKTFIHFDVKKLVLIKFSNGIELKVTPGHPILTTEGWKSLDIENSLYEHGVEATLLNVNDEILNYFGDTFVKEIKYMPELNYIVYNLEVDECHTFLASGIVVHNRKVVMDTGGYTGDWGSDEGRVAILHEKQLVLNKEDTKNFLDGVMVLRQITSNLGGSIQARVSGLKSSYFNANSTDEIQQKVQISASFPNVNSKRQIEEAFNDLVNLAAQRALRR